MARSVTLQRKVSFYPDPVYKDLLEALNQETGESKSSIANRALRELIDKMPDLQKRNLLQKHKRAS